MSNFITAIDKLLIYDPSRSKSMAHVYVSHQSPAEEKTLGKLLIITEINSKELINQDLINEIQEVIKTNYYGTEDLNTETAFEKALEKTNQKITDLLGLYESNWLDKFNICVAVLKDDILHFSHVGQISAILIHHEMITDIIATTPGLEIKVNPLKVFSNIVSGTLSPGDIILFCTPSLLDYMSLEKLKRMILAYTPHQAVMQLENLLAENGGFTAFAMIVAKLSSALDYAETPSLIHTVPMAASVSAPQSSMDELIKKEEATGKYLSPSLLSYFLQFIKTSWQKLIMFVRLKILRQSPRRLRLSQEFRDYGPSIKERQALRRKSATATFFSVLLSIGRKSIYFIIVGLRRFMQLFQKKREMALAEKTSRFSFGSTISNLIIRFKRLPRFSQIILVIIIIIAFAFTQSIVGMGKKKEATQRQTEYDQTVSSISQKTTEAESALSYGNEERAKQLLAEARNLLNGLPKKEDEQKQKSDELQIAINVQLYKTKHIIQIEKPNQVADFSTLDPLIKIYGLALISNNIYAFNPADNSVNQLNLDKKEVTALGNNELENNFQYILTESTSKLLFLDTANKLEEYDVNAKKLKPLQFALTAEEVNIADMAFYQSKIYLIDILNNQIYRAQKTDAGYSNPTNWVKDTGVDLRDSRSLAVDGSIYVLKSNGEVYRLSKGYKDDWQIETIDPVLNTPSQIWTDTSVNNIYILDSQGKRLVVFNKNGKFLNQYTSDRFNNLIDFVVKEKEKRAYLLNSTKIYEIELSQ